MYLRRGRTNLLMAKGTLALALALMLFLLPLTNAEVGWTNPTPYEISYYCSGQLQNPIWNYFFGDIVGDVNMKLVGDLAPNEISGEIPANGEVCWDSAGTQIDVTTYVRGIFADGPAIERGYIGHPPIGWLPSLSDPAPGLFPRYPPPATPATCRVTDSTFLNAINNPLLGWTEYQR